MFAAWDKADCEGHWGQDAAYTGAGNSAKCAAHFDHS